MQSSADGSTTFQYDAASQVTAATHTIQTSESYQYDANGNRTNTGTTTGDNNLSASISKLSTQGRPKASQGIAVKKGGDGWVWAG
jgi:YD repeat-containing protein